MLRQRLLPLVITALLAACQSASQPLTITPASSPSPTNLVASPTLTATPTKTAIPSLTPPDSTPTRHTPAETTSTLHPSDTPTPQVTTLLFTGVIVPARCVQAAIDVSGNPDYPYEEVSVLIAEADLAVGTLNATISDYPPRTGCVPTYVLVGGSENADALARAGFDVMSVATNHIKNCGLSNCGNRAFFDTLDNLRRVDILPVGAGADHDQAMQPVVVTINGVRFGFVSLGQIEPMAFARPDRPGIAVLNEENIRLAVALARQVADVVVALPHWGPEEVSTPNWSQRGLAVELVRAGADLVVGNHTHVVQGLQQIDGVQVFYGLGNFVFDQGPLPNKQGVILQVRFEGRHYAGYELIPTHVDRDGRVHLAGPEEAFEILERIRSASEALER